MRTAVAFLALSVALNQASARQPVCTAPNGSPVKYKAAPLSVKDVGGGYVPMVSWRKPGAPMVGSLHFDWGFSLTFADPRLRQFDRPTPGLHSATSGCWVAYHVRPEDGVNGQNAVVDASYELSPWANGEPERERPPSVPKIARYRFVTANKSLAPAYQWIGIWTANRARRSRVIAFGDGGAKILAELPLRLTGISTLPLPDAPPVAITLVGYGAAKSPVTLVELVWVPDLAPKP